MVAPPRHLSVSGRAPACPHPQHFEPFAPALRATAAPPFCFASGCAPVLPRIQNESDHPARCAGHVGFAGMPNGCGEPVGIVYRLPASALLPGHKKVTFANLGSQKSHLCNGFPQTSRFCKSEAHFGAQLLQKRLFCGASLAKATGLWGEICKSDWFAAPDLQK